MNTSTNTQTTEVARDLKSNRNDKLFIIGSRRSGTTWTLSLLANHPEIIGVLHTNIIRAFRDLDIWWNREDPYRNTIIGGTVENANIRDNLSESDFFDQCRQVSDLVLGKAFGQKSDAKYVVESQPENIDFLTLLDRLYPQARLLHVIRDPRAVFASWKSASTTWSSKDVFTANPVRFCTRWRLEISAARSLSGHADRYQEIQYETLKDDGVQQLAKVYKWLGVSTKEKIAEDAIEACKLENMRKRKIMPSGFFRKGQKSGWREELSHSEIRCIEYMLADLMDELGYERLNSGEIGKPFRVKRYELAREVFQWLSGILPLRIAKFLKSLFGR